MNVMCCKTWWVVSLFSVLFQQSFIDSYSSSPANLSFCRLSPLFFQDFYTVVLLNIVTLKAVIDVWNVLQNLMSCLTVFCPTQQRFLHFHCSILPNLSFCRRNASFFKCYKYSILDSIVAQYSDSQILPHITYIYDGFGESKDYQS